MRLRKLIENKNTKTISIFAYALVLAFSMGEHARSVSNWIFTHWLFNYHDGVVRRAFVGTIVNASGDGTVSENFVFKVSIYAIIFFALLLISITLVSISEGHHLNLKLSLLITTFVVTCPGGIQQYVYDMGRFDLFGGFLLLIGFSFFLNERISNRNDAGMILLIISILLSLLSILIHEITVL